MLSMALAGLGRLQDAHLALDDAFREARRCNDEFGTQSVFASRIRLLVQEGRAREACALEPPELEGALPSMHGEVLASRALALTAGGRFEEARSQSAIARKLTQAVETRVLTAVVDALCALKQHKSGMR